MQQLYRTPMQKCESLDCNLQMTEPQFRWNSWKFLKFCPNIKQNRTGQGVTQKPAPSIKTIVGRRYLTLFLFCEDPAYPSFSHFVQPPNPALFVALFLRLNVWSSFMQFMQKDVKFTQGLTWMIWLWLILWFEITHKNNHTGHTGANRLINRY